MHTYFSKTATIFGIAAILFVTSCSDAPKGDNTAVTNKQEAAATAGKMYKVDPGKSYVHFTGNGVGKNHPGKFTITSGSVAVKDNKVAGGEFTIDINSIQMEEQGEMIQNKLKPHLLSADFLDAAKYGTAHFEITKTEPFNGSNSAVVGANYTVSGNLTLKDVTKNISFPAKIDVDGNSVKAAANFDIDRTEWQIKYGNDKSLGDKFISEKVNIQLHVEAGK